MEEEELCADDPEGKIGFPGATTHAATAVKSHGLMAILVLSVTVSVSLATAAYLARTRPLRVGVIRL